MTGKFCADGFTAFSSDPDHRGDSSALDHDPADGTTIDHAQDPAKMVLPSNTWCYLQHITQSKNPQIASNDLFLEPPYNKNYKKKKVYLYFLLSISLWFILLKLLHFMKLIYL